MIRLFASAFVAALGFVLGMALAFDGGHPWLGAALVVISDGLLLSIVCDD